MVYSSEYQLYCAGPEDLRTRYARWRATRDAEKLIMSGFAELARAEEAGTWLRERSLDWRGRRLIAHGRLLLLAAGAPELYNGIARRAYRLASAEAAI